jgi:hypothetical protein
MNSDNLREGLVLVKANNKNTQFAVNPRRAVLSTGEVSKYSAGKNGLFNKFGAFPKIARVSFKLCATFNFLEPTTNNAT